MTAEQAIERSVSHGEIVSVEWSQALADDLSLESEDSTDASETVTEYWGTTGDGAEWRVHLTRSAASLPDDAVIVEIMPEWLRESHRQAGNWGAYPRNGAERIIMSRIDADAMIEDREYDHVVRDAKISDLGKYEMRT